MVLSAFRLPHEVILALLPVCYVPCRRNPEGMRISGNGGGGEQGGEASFCAQHPCQVILLAPCSLRRYWLGRVHTYDLQVWVHSS